MRVHFGICVCVCVCVCCPASSKPVVHEAVVADGTPQAQHYWRLVSGFLHLHFRPDGIVLPCFSVFISLWPQVVQTVSSGPRDPSLTAQIWQ